MNKPVYVIPSESYGSLGSGLSVTKGKRYKAIPATNQPDHLAQGLYFVDGVLLSVAKGEIRLCK